MDTDIKMILSSVFFFPCNNIWPINENNFVWTFPALPHPTQIIFYFSGPYKLVQFETKFGQRKKRQTRIYWAVGIQCLKPHHHCCTRHTSIIYSTMSMQRMPLLKIATGYGNCISTNVVWDKCVWWVTVYAWNEIIVNMHVSMGPNLIIQEFKKQIKPKCSTLFPFSNS